SSARAYGRAHRPLSSRRPVVAHIALHHQVEFCLHLRYAERTSQHAVAARDATRLACRLHYAVACALDRICGADFGAGRLVAMHTDDRRRLHRMCAIDVFQMDHRVTSVRVTFAARLHTRLAADAAVGVDEKFHVRRNRHYGPRETYSLPVAQSGGLPAFITRTAQTLYSGIFEIGSCAEIVNWFALLCPAQWYGMKIVSGRIVVTTCARSVIRPRRDSANAQSPSLIPNFSASCGCISMRGSEYCSTRGPMRRVCVPDRNWLTTRPVVSISGYSSSMSSAGGVYGATLNRALPSWK